MPKPKKTLVELKNKDILSLKDLSLEEINLILEQAKFFKKIFHRSIKQTPALRGRTIVNLFFEPSTRTRTSFEIAAKMLGANATNIALSQSSLKKGETLIDTVKNIEVMGVDAFVIRHSQGGAPWLVSKNVDVPVINAGDGFHEHPTQGLLDIFTMREAKGDLKGKKVIIVGDISHSRVARSNIWGLNKLGAQVTVVGPPFFIPKDIEKMNVKVSYNLKEVLPTADFINVLRIQLERHDKQVLPSIREYIDFYGITTEKLSLCKKDVVIMHPGPINRGIEISSEIADGPYNVILRQVNNGVAVRMAILFLLMKWMMKKTKNQGT